ncbi:MAG: ABC transporter substrate-binding protein [Bacteroidota bacterium]
MKYYLILLLAGLTACSPAEESVTGTDTPAEALRIVSLGGSLTELLYDLGYGDAIVGVDVTSVYPTAVNNKPKLGHLRQLNVEGLLELNPTVIFTDAETKDNQALNTIAEAGVEIIYVPLGATLDNAAKAAAFLGQHLELPPTKVSAYRERIRVDSLALAATLADAKGPQPRVLFVYARGANRLMVAGADTEAATMIELAGGKNAINSFTDFKPLTPEALVEAAPDVILMFTSGLKSLDGKEGLAGVPGISATPAYRQDRIVAMDGLYLLGFGPRAARAANELAQYLYPAQTK